MKITMVMGEAAHSMGTFVASLSSVLVAKGHDVQIIAEPTSAKRYLSQECFATVARDTPETVPDRYEFATIAPGPRRVKKL